MADQPSITVPTLAQALARLRAQLPDGFVLTNHDPFGVFETYLTLLAQVEVDDLSTINSLLLQGFPATATNLWLDYHGQSLGLTRILASRAEHDILFNLRASGTVPAGAVVQTELDASGQALRFLVVEDTAVEAPSGVVRVRAETAGVAYNVGAGRITTLATVLPFVVGIQNEMSSPVVPGVDRETDDLFRQRLLLRWPALSRGSTYHSYVLWAREVPGIIKVAVLDEHPRGQGTVDVVVAPSRGEPTAGQLIAVNDLVQARRPLTADVLVRAPTLVPLAVPLTLYLKPTASRDVSLWRSRVQAVFDGQTIGETFYPSRVTDELHNHSDVAGVVNGMNPQPSPAARDELFVAGDVQLVLA